MGNKGGLRSPRDMSIEELTLLDPYMDPAPGTKELRDPGLYPDIQLFIANVFNRYLEMAPGRINALFSAFKMHVDGGRPDFLMYVRYARTVILDSGCITPLLNCLRGSMTSTDAHQWLDQAPILPSLAREMHDAGSPPGIAAAMDLPVYADLLAAADLTVTQAHDITFRNAQLMLDAELPPGWRPMFTTQGITLAEQLDCLAEYDRIGVVEAVRRRDAWLAIGGMAYESSPARVFDIHQAIREALGPTGHIHALGVNRLNVLIPLLQHGWANSADSSSPVQTIKYNRRDYPYYVGGPRPTFLVSALHAASSLYFETSVAEQLRRGNGAGIQTGLEMPGPTTVGVPVPLGTVVPKAATVGTTVPTEVIPTPKPTKRRAFKIGFQGTTLDEILTWADTVVGDAPRLVVSMAGSGKDIARLARAGRTIVSWDTQILSSYVVNGVFGNWSGWSVPLEYGEAEGYAYRFRPLRSMPDDSARVADWIATRGDDYDRVCLAKALIQSTFQGRLTAWTRDATADDLWQLYLKAHAQLQPWVDLPGTFRHHHDSVFDDPTFTDEVRDAVLYVDTPKVLNKGPKGDIYSAGFGALNSILAQSPQWLPPWTEETYWRDMPTLWNAPYRRMILFHATRCRPTVEELGARLVADGLIANPDPTMVWDHGARGDVVWVIER